MVQGFWWHHESDLRCVGRFFVYVIADYLPTLTNKPDLELVCNYFVVHTIKPHKIAGSNSFDYERCFC